MSAPAAYSVFDGPRYADLNLLHKQEQLLACTHSLAKRLQIPARLFFFIRPPVHMRSSIARQASSKLIPHTRWQDETAPTAARLGISIEPLQQIVAQQVCFCPSFLPCSHFRAHDPSLACLSCRSRQRCVSLPALEPCRASRQRTRVRGPGWRGVSLIDIPPHCATCCSSIRCVRKTPSSPLPPPPLHGPSTLH